MTANLSFQIEKHAGRADRSPTRRLRFHPKPEQVRPSDRADLEGESDDDERGRRQRRGRQADAKADDAAPNRNGELRLGRRRRSAGRRAKSSPA